MPRQPIKVEIVEKKTTAMEKVALRISFAAMLIAVAAVGVSLWVGYETRNHNRLSVMPQLEMDGQFAGRTEYDGFYVINKGIGPAIIKRYDVYFDHKRFEGTKDEFFGKLHKRIGIPVLGQPVHLNLSLPHAVSVKETLPLYTYKPDWSDNRYEQARNDLNNHVQIEIEYCSFYDDCKLFRY